MSIHRWEGEEAENKFIYSALCVLTSITVGIVVILLALIFGR